MWFHVEAVPLSFTESAPFRFENSVIIDATPERVFEIVATAEAQTEWFKDLIDIRWKTAARGVGSEREVELKATTVKERFLMWEPGKRLAFTIYGMTLPMVTAMVEDMTFEPVGPTQTRLVWIAHYRPTFLMRCVHPIARMIFGGLFSESAKGLAAYAKAHPTAPLKN